MKYILEYNEISEYDIFLDEYQDWLNEYHGHEEDILAENMVIDIFADRKFLLNFSNDLLYFTEEESLELKEFINNSSDEMLIEGIGNFMKNVVHKIKQSPSVIKHGIKKASSSIGSTLKSAGQKIKTVGTKIANAAIAVKDFIGVVLKEFNKSFMLFTKDAEKDVRVAATWTIQKYNNIEKAAKKAKKEEKMYFESVIKFFEGIKDKIKNAFKSGVESGVKESLNEYGVFDLLTEDLKIKPSIKTFKKITHKVDKVMKKELQQGDHEHGAMPKGTKAKIFHSVELAVYKVGDILDIIDKNTTEIGLKGFAAGIAAAGGPKKPEGGFPYTSLVYTYSGIHHSGKGGLLKNWKTPLRMMLNHGAVKGAAALAATATAPLSLIGLGIGTLVKVLNMVKKAQITAMILKMAGGDEPMEKITKRSTKMFSGGAKHYFSKDA